MNSQSFLGPVFVVGMPRSGTKLLRGLLNQHPLIKIDTTESDFLPYWINHWKRFGDLRKPETFTAFYMEACKLSYMKKKEAWGVRIGRDEWYEACEAFDPASVFEALIKHHIGYQKHSATIWGDKTPSYLTKTAMLKRVYPRARFIHIVRDVRDFCLSIHKAWNKSMYRAAQRWTDDVAAARQNGHVHGDYLEIKYETLIGDAETELRRACEFLDLDYSLGMEMLSKSVEKTGDAKGAYVDAANKAKYQKLMAQETILGIESIARNTLLEFGYSVENAGPVRRLSFPMALYYRLTDGLALIKRKRMQALTDVVTGANRQE